MWTRPSPEQRKNKIYDKKESYIDIVISDKKRGIIMSKMGRYNVSMNVAVTTNIK